MSKTVTVYTAGGHGKEVVTIPGPYKTFAEVKAANRKHALKVDRSEFWGRGEIRFFDSKPLRSSPLQGRFVIDSTQMHDKGRSLPRQWSVCVVLDSGDVERVSFLDLGGMFIEEFRDSDSAKRALKELLEKECG